MPFLIVRNDITKMKVDAIVSGGNGGLENRGGVSGRIFETAGQAFDDYCSKLDGCAPGEAIVTPGFELPAKYVIHTVGPRWRGGHNGEEHTLRLCYKNVLSKAAELKCKTVAFPLIASGNFNYPKNEAIKVAHSEIAKFLSSRDEDMQVYLVVFSAEAYLAGKKTFPDLRAYIDDNYSGDCDGLRHALLQRALPSWAPEVMNLKKTGEAEAAKKQSGFSASNSPPSKECLKDFLAQKGKSFKELLREHIQASGMTDPEVYNKANITKQVFSKIINKEGYSPSKPTVIALSVALKLDIDNTLELLSSLGLTLSKSSMFDIIVQYHITKEIWDIYDINDSLFLYDQPLLGSCVA